MKSDFSSQEANDLRVLITGASGFIGRHLVAKLKADGNHIVILSRGGEAPADADIFAGPAQLAEIDEWDTWPEGIEAVVHLAAKISAQCNEPIGFNVNIEGTRALATRARRQGVKRIIFLSTANVHGLGRAAPYQEEDALDPPNAYAKSKEVAEDALWSTLGDERSIGTVLRPPPVFGKGGHGLVAKLVRLAKSPVPLPLKGIGAPRSVIAADHLSEIISLCLVSDSACGETFLVADDEPVRPEDIVRAVRRGLNRPARLLPAPIGLIHMAAKLGGREHTWETRTRPCLLNTARMKAKLGWTSPVPTMEKIRILAASGDFA